MLAEVQQHVDQARAHFARRRQGTGVISVGEQASSPTHQPIDRQGNADGEPSDAIPQGDVFVSFDEQVNVVLLYREVNHAEAFVAGTTDRSLQGQEDSLRRAE
jgi:hypothetical protein